MKAYSKTYRVNAKGFYLFLYSIPFRNPFAFISPIICYL